MNSQIKVQITEDYSTSSLFRLKLFGNYTVIQSSIADLNIEVKKDIDALLIRSGTPINAKTLKGYENLKVIVTATTGFDHIDLSDPKVKKINIFHSPNSNSISAAEQTWALLLAGIKSLSSDFSNVEKGLWRKGLPPTLELFSKTIGLIGLGRVGKRVAKMAKAFDMNIMAYDPYVNDDVFTDLDIERVGFSELLIGADIVSFHVPLTSKTRKMLNRKNLELLGTGKILINTSRGEILCEQDIIEYLNKNHFFFLGLDVLEHEPPQSINPLLSHKKVFITPHRGGKSKESIERASNEAVGKLIDFFMGKSPSNQLPPRANWYFDDKNIKSKDSKLISTYETSVI